MPTKAADGPVLGVTRNDVEAFLDAHNRDARDRGEPWLWDLPSPLQIERAGRGADGVHRGQAPERQLTSG